MFGGRKALLFQLRFWVQAFSGQAAPSTSTHLTLKHLPSSSPKWRGPQCLGTQGANTLLTGLPWVCVHQSHTVQRHGQSPISSHSKGSRMQSLALGCS